MPHTRQPPPPQPPSFAQLEQAALHIIRLINDTPGLEKTKLAVIGDLALRKYLPECDRTTSIDFVISKSSSPGRVRKEIVGHPMSPLRERSGAVYFTSSSSSSPGAAWEIEVKLIPDWLCPYLPDAARPVNDENPPRTLPYISLGDLVVFKADACGLRDHDASKRREAREAAALLELASEHSPLQVDDEKMERVRQALGDLIEHSMPEQDAVWWQRRLGRVTGDHGTIQAMFSDLADSSAAAAASAAANRSPPMSPGPGSPTSSAPGSARSSIYSTISRTSSISSVTPSESWSSMSPASPRSAPPEKNGRPRKMSVTGSNGGVNKGPLHKRFPSNGVVQMAAASLDAALQRTDIGIARPPSPGVSLMTRI